jgi:hypothetical protein
VQSLLPASETGRARSRNATTAAAASPERQISGVDTNGSEAYAESKLLDVLLAFGVARRWPDVVATALEPGRVPTRMGGPVAPDDMDLAHRTQVAGDKQGPKSADERRLLLSPRAQGAEPAGARRESARSSDRALCRTFWN